jgi:lipopolysaccharide export system permease protein
MAIAEGSADGDYNIKVNKKSETTEVLTGITIHKKSSIGDGSKTVIKAKDGKLRKSTILQISLMTVTIMKIYSNKYEDRIKMPFVKSHYKKYTHRFVAIE